MTQRALVTILVLLLAGCASHSEPKGNQDFYTAAQLADFEGVYKNKGDPVGFLSQVIWDTGSSTPPVVHYQDVEFIEVSSTKNSLTAKAIQNGCVIYEKSYVLGRDFEIDGGKISIHREVSLLTRGPGDVLLGPSYEKISLGLDAGKNGKFRYSGYAAGLAFLFLPIAASDMRDVRFERVADKPHGYKACDNR
jgi:hypothetical protein